jgi:hypothetical protein
MVTPDDEDYDSDDPIQVAAHAAAADRASQLRHNYRQLDYALSVDRDSPYFPGEAMKVEIRITNPTSSPLEIPDPNNPAVQCFTGHVEEWCRVPLKVPSTTIQPGQTITLTVDSEDPDAAKGWGFGPAPASPGKCKLRYLLGGSVEFEVGEPVLEASAVVPLQVFKSYQAKGVREPKTLQYAAMIVAVQLNGEHLVLVGQHDVMAGYEVEVGREPSFADDMAWRAGRRTRSAPGQADRTLSSRTAATGAPWVRLTTSSSAITSLKGMADSKGRITVEYTAAGVPQTLYLNEQRRLGR